MIVILQFRRLLVCFALALLSGCGAGRATVEAPPAERIPGLEARVQSSPSDVRAAVRLGAAYREADRMEEARAILEDAVQRRPGFGPAHLLLGLVHEDREQWAEARRVYEGYLERDGDDEVASTIRDRMPLVRRGEMLASVDSIVAREAELADRRPAPRTVAVFPFLYRGADTTYARLSRALSAFLVTDLSQTDRLTVLERARVQMLLDELQMARSDYVNQATAARTGRMLGARTLVQGLLEADGSTLRVEASAVDAADASAEPASLVSGDEPVERLFEMENRIALAVYRELGIELTPAERDRVTRQPTRSLEAFLAFGRGLMAEDDGVFAEAARHYDRASQLDPGFEEAVARREEAESLSAASATPTDAVASVALGGLETPSADQMEAVFNARRAVDEAWLLAPTPIGRDAVSEVLGFEGISAQPGEFRIIIQKPGGTP